MTHTRPLFSVYEDGTVQAQVFPGRYSLATTPAQRATLQAPRVLEQSPEFLKLQYRALSQSLVWQEGFWGMVVTDFSKEGVLKPAAPMLQGVTVMPDHGFSSENYLGIVEEAFWTEDINGVPVSGIDAIYKLDRKPQLPPEHPHRIILRGVEQGYIKGSSVRVWFDYEKSHPSLDDWTFYEQMGTEVDGQIVRFIVTHVRRFLETSIVIAGADPLAQPADHFEDDDRAELAASFSSTGWSLPERPAMVSLSDNPHQKEKSPMARKKKLDVQAEDELVEADVVDAPAEDGEQAPEEDPQEELDQEEVTTLTPDEDDGPIDDDTIVEDGGEDEEAEPDLLEQASTSALTAEMDAAIKAAVARELAAQAEAFEAEKAELTAKHAAELQAKDRRQTLTTFYADLQAGNLPASFDELNVVDGLMTLSQEPTISLGTGETVSQQAWVQMLLVEAAKFAQVPVGEFAKNAKDPTDAEADRKARLNAAIKEKLEANPKLGERLAMKELAVEHPELFPK